MDLLIGDIIYELFKNLSVSDAYQLSIINREFNNKFEWPELWNHYMSQIDPSILDTIRSVSCKLTCRKFSDLSRIIKLLKLDENMLVLYQKHDLLLQFRQITSIPSETVNYRI